MMKYDTNTLEFDSFKECILDNFISSFSKSSFKNINILSSVEEIYKRQNEIKQAIEFRESSEIVDDDNEFFSLFYTLNDNTKSFNPTDFVVIKNFLLKLETIKLLVEEKKFKYLYPYTETFASYRYLIELIMQSVDDKGVIKDNATSALQEIRYGINQHKKSIRKLLSNLFNSSNADKFIQEKVVVLRNGRYTIPCKTNFSQYIQGIIQDKSASGQTLYIEVSSCVSENNAMQELIIAESAEIAKIIYSLISSVKSSLIDLNKTVKTYSYLIMIIELGIFYSSKEYTFGEYSSSMEFTQIHHPLLYLRKGNNSIPIDFSITNYGDNIIITGPNTGGKTAALKSIGLNHLISYCGLPVFGSYFKFMYFDSIYADIGDNQSIIMDLSTFSSHMVNINKIITKSGDKTLVLFDELGTGTEPREGASLAVAILKNLVKKQATVILTTHFSEVKNYALNSDNSMFYSVDFDYELTENGGVYTIEVKSQTFTVSENKVGITVKYLPLTYAFGDVESFTIADVMGYTIDEDTGKVTDKDGEEVTGIMKAFADKKIGELTTAIDTLTLVDVFGEVDENSVFTLIEGYETLPISQVPDKLVEAVSNSTINELVSKGVISSSSVESLNDTLKAKTVNELISSLSNIMGKTLAELNAEGLIEIDIESYPNLANKTLEDILDLAEEAAVL